MRELDTFTFRDRLQLVPLANLPREKRYDLALTKYLCKDVAEIEYFVASLLKGPARITPLRAEQFRTIISI